MRGHQVFLDDNLQMCDTGRLFHIHHNWFHAVWLFHILCTGERTRIYSLLPQLCRAPSKPDFSIEVRNCWFSLTDGRIHRLVIFNKTAVQLITRSTSLDLTYPWFVNISLRWNWLMYPIVTLDASAIIPLGTTKSREVFLLQCMAFSFCRFDRCALRWLQALTIFLVITTIISFCLNGLASDVASLDRVEYYRGNEQWGCMKGKQDSDGGDKKAIWSNSLTFSPSSCTLAPTSPKLQKQAISATSDKVPK